MPRFCDIVMKGGITSGIVYPAAVVEIAKDFVFKNVGGTSAGAIAAALTAAAERRRYIDGSYESFDRVGQIPTYLMTDSRLFKLFAPNSRTTSLFRTLISLAGRPRFRPALLAKWCGLLWAYPLASVIGAAPGVVSLVAVARTRDETAAWLWWFAIVIAAATIAGGVTIAAAIALARDLLGRLPANGYGLVTGMNDADRTSEVALSTWLAAEMQRTAGLPGNVPLTFGMLWDARRDPALPGLEEQPETPDVNLEMITTNVTYGRPYSFPITTHEFFFDPDELKRYVPDYVVGWMIARSRAPRDADEAARFQRLLPKRALPLMGDMPVIVATRMSLAFPVLLSAVPLYAADRSAAPQPDGFFPLERVWFSDGGLSSNFPITLFDAPLPRWPTFAMNLAAFPPGKHRVADEAQNVYMITRNEDGRLPAFNRIHGLTGFVSAIVNAMQNWNDNTQATLPGYRDRIVTVFLDTDEGGLNLDMPPEVLSRLQKRGAAAGALLASRFRDPSTLDPVKPPQLGWENHRWLRFRTTMSSLRAFLGMFGGDVRNPEAPDVSYSALIEARNGTPARSYPLKTSDRTGVDALVRDTVSLADSYDNLGALDDHQPNPPPHLVPRGSLKS